MTTSPRGERDDGSQTDEARGGCRDCDPHLLNHLKCSARGIKAQSGYNDQHLTELDTARTQYDAARHLYSEARKAAKPSVKDLGEQLTQVIEQLKCLVNDSHVIHLLDEAYEIVERKLRRCYPCEGCTFDGDCDFDDQVDTCGDDVIESMIASITRQTDAAKKVFDDLIGEPKAIADKVAKLTADVKKIVDGMALDSRSVDFKALYAAALVAQGDQKAIFRGFENVNSYMDCLCAALMCLLRGHEAVAKLTGKQAVRQCHQDQDKERCERLKSQTADEVIAEYLRLKERSRRDEEDRDRDHGRDRDSGRDRGYDSDRESGSGRHE